MLILRGRLVSAELPTRLPVMAAFSSTQGKREQAASGWGKTGAGREATAWHACACCMRMAARKHDAAQGQTDMQDKTGQAASRTGRTGRQDRQAGQAGQDRQDRQAGQGSRGPTWHKGPTVAQGACVHQLMWVDAGNRAAGDVAHVVHAALQSRGRGRDRDRARQAFGKCQAGRQAGSLAVRRVENNNSSWCRISARAS